MSLPPHIFIRSQMDFFRYYFRVLRVALTHTLEAAHSILLVFFIVAGLVTYFYPRTEIPVDLHGWQVAAITVTAMVAVRLFLAPFWIWKEDQAQLSNLRRRVESKERDEQRFRVRTAAIDKIASEISWAVNNLVNPTPHPANTSNPDAAIAEFEQKFRNWEKRVSIILQDREVFTQGDQTNFDDLGFVPLIINTWGHQKLNNLFSQLNLKIQRLREIENQARMRHGKP
jgi:hypothetical protein